MKFDVLNRYSGAVEFTAEIECAADAPRSIKVGLAVKWALRTGTNLREADLSGADLSRADLRGAALRGAALRGAHLSEADLSGADLSGADLSEADLSGAALRRADLSGADLSEADLSGADLSRAYLRRAYLSGADLSEADLSEADLSRAYLRGADLSEAYLSGTDKIDPSEIPVVPQIDAKILASIEAGGTLDMSSWHGPDGWCGTTHCRGGWAVHHAGPLGKALEEKVGTRLAAAMIYRASRPGEPAPWFFASDEAAMADIRACAARQLAENAGEGEV